MTVENELRTRPRDGWFTARISRAMFVLGLVGLLVAAGGLSDAAVSSTAGTATAAQGADQREIGPASIQVGATTGSGYPVDGFTFFGPDTSSCETPSRYEQALPYHNTADPTSPVRKLVRSPWPEPPIELDTIWYAGTYELLAVSYDGYINRMLASPQTQEVWRVEFLGEDGDVVATSNQTADLADGVAEASWEGSIGPVTLDELAVAVRVVHAATSLGPNSVVPVCLSGRLTSGPGPALFPSLAESWGHLGTLGAQFDDPRDIAIGPDGRLYIADSGNHRVQVLHQDGTFDFGWGVEGRELPAFENPFSIDVTRSGTIYVADPSTSVVSIYASDGRLNDFVILQGTAPSGVAADENGTMFVADSRNDEVLEVSPSGDVVNSFGQFDGLVDVALSPGGEVYATDNGRVQIFDVDGQLLRTLTEAGPGDALGGGLRIGFGNDGDVFVSEYFKNRIVRFDSGGDVTDVWGQASRFENPSGVAVNIDGDVFVLQSGRPLGNRVDRFVFMPAP